MGRRASCPRAPGLEADHLERGRDSYRRRAWGDAYDALLRADEIAPLPAGDLDCLATAAFLTGRNRDHQQLLERLYRVHVESGERARAARCAFWLAVSFLLQGERGQSNAWTARGQRLVDEPDCVERGYLAVVVAEQQLSDGRLGEAHATSGEAFAVGASFRDADLMAAARHTQGRALIQQGRIAAGLTCLDETMLAVVGGELGPLLTGRMYCSVIDVCRQVYALGRAREWTSAFSRVCEAQPDLAAFTGICLVHRAEIMQLQGEWPEALEELRRACEQSRRANRALPGAGLYRQAEIHRLRGECAEAEDAYRAASGLGFEPHPGLALLRLAQGRRDAACAAIRRLTSTTGDPVRRAAILPAHLEIMLACDDLEEARRARDELRDLAGAFDTDVLRAVVAQADGAIALAEGRAQAALEPLRRALAFWQDFDAPYDAARVRVLIGQACRALGDDEAAGLELEAARRVFQRLGARPDLACVDAPPRPGSPSSSPLTARELQVLRLIATGRTNKAIARSLSLSERTVDRHVTNILTKLAVRSRTAATAYAFDHKLF